MPYLPTYDSRDSRYKSPYGAVSSGTQVQLTLRPPRAECFSHASVNVRFESRFNEILILKMPWQGHDLGQDLFSVELDTTGYVGLVWYSFRLEKLNGRGQELGPYQLTVYDGAREAPSWFGEGVTYQIFPDRFRRSKVPDPEGLVGGRTVHQSWEEFPEYRPDDQGEVETLYFNPIFEAAENHRYGTADYSRVDPMLGTNEDFARLCEEAHRQGMRVMLDGVFNHTGYVSRYFNGDGFYPEAGAAQSQESPYYSWFNFTQWPNRYDSWWGIYSLPAVNENDPGYREFIFGGKDSVVRRWLRAGADGWRLDVADELPDDFVHGIHEAARAEKPDAVIIGEVWEDGSTKVAYGVRRKHILGGHCDGLMNYPLRSAILSFFQGGGGEAFVKGMETIRENYPAFAFYSSMNSLDTHDTPRFLTLLGAGGEYRDQSREWRAGFTLSPKQLNRGRKLLKAAALLLFCFPGSPTVYYGDEVGMEGFEDPFNRQTYPWGYEDQELLEWYRALGRLRGQRPALRRGGIRYVCGRGPLLAFVRESEEERLLCAFNAGKEKQTLVVEEERLCPVLGQVEAAQVDGVCEITLPPRSGAVLEMP